MNARELAKEILKRTANCLHLEKCGCETEVFAALEGFRSQVLYHCLQAVYGVKEPSGPMPPENIELHKKSPEASARALIRMTKNEAARNIDKIDWEKLLS